MRHFILFVTVLLSGCVAPSTYILRREPATSSITLIDQRPLEESLTKNVTRFITYIGDDSFVPKKMSWLAWRLEREFPNLAGKEITVKHFYFLSVTGQSSSAVAGAPLAGISYAGALLVNAAFCSSKETGQVMIELEIDGSTYRANKVTPLVTGYNAEKHDAAALSAIEATFGELANSIRAGPSAQHEALHG